MSSILSISQWISHKALYSSVIPVEDNKYISYLFHFGILIQTYDGAMAAFQQPKPPDRQIMDFQLLLQNIDGDFLKNQFGPTTSVKNCPSIGAEMIQPPPSNVRKSNFFNFTLSWFDGRKTPVKITKCSYHSFVDNEEGNGVIYKAILELNTGELVEKLFTVQLVNSASKELIRLDSAALVPAGPQRVLVTHRDVCSRCSQGKVCGSSLDSPTDPQIISDNLEMKIFLKCNQNCLRGPGNPKGCRRFQINVSSGEEGTSALCWSQPIFVHNNSKHTKTKSFTKSESDFQLPEDKRNSPRIIAISPSEGWAMGGQTIVIIGDNFKVGMQVIFGGIPLACQVISSHAVRVQSPPGVGVVEVSLALDCHQYNLSSPGTFTYISTTQAGLDQGFSRLARLVPRVAGDPCRLARDVVLHRAADILQARQAGQTVLPAVPELEESKPKIEELLLAPWISELQDCDY